MKNYFSPEDIQLILQKSHGYDQRVIKSVWAALRRQGKEFFQCYDMVSEKNCYKQLDTTK